MEAHDYEVQPEASPARAWFLNLLTVLLLLGVLCVAAGFLIIFLDPYSRLNPFPPPTPPTPLGFPTDTPTPIGMLPPTWTPEPTLEPSATPTLRPSSTPLPTDTPFTVVPPTALRPTATATATRKTPIGGYPFALQRGSPVPIQNIYHPELGCNWMGVGGQAVDMSGGPVTGLVIRLGGFLAGVPIPDTMTSLTGVALNYGRAGYEFTLADRPIASKNTLWIQVLNQEGLPLSDRIYFETYDDCNRNLIIINFKQVR